LLHV